MNTREQSREVLNKSNGCKQSEKFEGISGKAIEFVSPTLTKSKQLLLIKSNE